MSEKFNRKQLAFIRSAVNKCLLTNQEEFEVHEHQLDLSLLTVILQIETLSTIRMMEKKVMASLDALTAQVTKNTDVEASAVILIQGIAQQLKDAGTDPTKLAELASKLSTSADSLAAAVAANTPVA